MFQKDITKQYTTKNDSELKAIQHSQPDSTIIRGNVVDSLEENLDKDVSPEEIQKFMKDHKEELVKYINETNNNDKINETIYEELIKDEKIISIIQEMTKDSDVRKAVLN